MGAMAQAAVLELRPDFRKLLFLTRAGDGECLPCGKVMQFRAIASPFFQRTVVQCMGCGGKIALKG